MRCNCKGLEFVIGLVLLLVAAWPNFFGIVANRWIVGVAAVFLILHSSMCNRCSMKKMDHMPARTVARKKSSSRKSSSSRRRKR